jgi:hypothetical protein
MIRFMFLRNANKQPVGCIAVDVSIGLLTYGVSVLNPLDKFDRVLARSIAVGRWGSSTASRSVRIDTSVQPNMHQISATVMRDIADDHDAPSRARKAARLWLNNNATR